MVPLPGRIEGIQSPVPILEPQQQLNTLAAITVAIWKHRGL